MLSADHVLVIEQMYDARRPLRHRDSIGGRPQQMEETQRRALLH